MAATRKNQATLTVAEWTALIDAINSLHGIAAAAPAYRDFVAVHVRAMNPLDPAGMAWAVHTMGPMMPGRNFLPWHRWYLHRPFTAKQDCGTAWLSHPSCAVCAR